MFVVPAKAGIQNKFLGKSFVVMLRQAQHEDLSGLHPASS
jgi:hypothetical protein